jgi:hypothetical protein
MAFRGDAALSIDSHASRPSSSSATDVYEERSLHREAEDECFKRLVNWPIVLRVLAKWVARSPYMVKLEG